ncbi:hypothetical protein DdX_22322 [Ditylenchus destructor]|uniref:Uncharacterized protein n=1 Tax=Ditylenchus destructor TaxID=166010 RepID=A0AAD4QUJ5_9BILA|nr:hypothetical protein DdX_22322 [Ditylenchus destructor]
MYTFVGENYTFLDASQVLDCVDHERVNTTCHELAKRLKQHYVEKCGTLAGDLFNMRYAAALVVLRAGYGRCDAAGCKHYVPPEECEDLVSWECALDCPQKVTPSTTPSGSEAPVVTDLLYYLIVLSFAIFS